MNRDCEVFDHLVLCDCCPSKDLKVDDAGAVRGILVWTWTSVMFN
jgi:hypothetical protein